MSNNKTHFIIEEYFKTEDINLRLVALQDIFLKLIKTCEVIETSSLLDTSSIQRRTSHESSSHLL